MACTIVFHHFRSGVEGLTLKLSDVTGATVNGESDALSDSSHDYRYEATVSESLVGWFTAQVLDSVGVLYTGRVKVVDDGGTFLIDDPAAIADITVTVEEVTVGALSATALQQLAGTRQINITVPTLLGRNLTDPLIRGDNYTVALESAIEFSRSDFPNIPDGATAVLTAKIQECGSNYSFTIAGDQASIPVRTGAKVVRFEATSDESRLWEPGQYEFDVEITFPDGEKRTFVGPGVFLRVVNDMTQPTVNG